MEPNLKFKALRKSKNLSQIEFSQLLGVSQGTIGDIERGRIGISKRMKSKIIEKMNIETGYFDDRKDIKNIELEQGSETGGKQGFDKKIANLQTSRESKKANGFPYDYFDGGNFYLNQHFEKKLLIDIIKNHKNTNELQGYLNTIGNFEFIIDNLNHYYFNKVELQFHSSSKYLKEGKFLYDQFKADFITEMEKLEVIKPALAKLSVAIEAFYDEIKEFDKENIISGYFGQKPL